MKPLFETEGWEPITQLSCRCPKCQIVVSSNAYARCMHKKKCAGWLATPVVTASSVRKLPRRALAGPVVEALPISSPAAPARLGLARPTGKVPVLRWEEHKMGGFAEWHTRNGPHLLRVRLVGMPGDERRYSAYCDLKYAGSFADVNTAQDEAVRLMVAMNKIGM
jgi:hypothetical protein